MSAIKIIGKLNPKQYSEMLDHLTRKKIKNPFIKAEDIVVNKKPEVEQREMFNRFNQANPRQDMAGGGMLVQPRADGSRPGYSGKTAKKAILKLPDEGEINLGKLAKKHNVSTSLISQYRDRYKPNLTSVIDRKPRIMLTKEQQKIFRAYKKYFPNAKDSVVRGKIKNNQITEDTITKLKKGISLKATDKDKIALDADTIKKIKEKIKLKPGQKWNFYNPETNPDGHTYGIKKSDDVNLYDQARSIGKPGRAETKLKKAKKKYKQIKADPELLAQKKAYDREIYMGKRDEVLEAYRLRYETDKDFRERKLEWARQDKIKNPEKYKQKLNDYYAKKGRFPPGNNYKENVWRDMFRSSQKLGQERFLLVDEKGNLLTEDKFPKVDGRVRWDVGGAYKKVKFYDTVTEQFVKFDNNIKGKGIVFEKYLDQKSVGGKGAYKNAINGYKNKDDIKNLTFKDSKGKTIRLGTIVQERLNDAVNFINSGVNVQHPDLDNAFWKNEVSLASANQELNYMEQTLERKLRNAGNDITKRTKAINDFKSKINRQPGGITKVIEGKTFGIDPTKKSVVEALGKEFNLNKFKDFKNIVATLGGEDCGRIIKYKGGRIGLQDGTPNVDVCFRNATNRINSGFKNATPAEARNYTKLLNAVKGSAVIGRNLLKFGIVPEALYVGADSLIRVGFGDTFKEAGLRAADFFIPGDQMQEADKLKVQRTLGDAAATNVGKVFDYRNQIANIDSLEKQKANLENLSDVGEFDYIGDLSQDVKNIDTRLNQAKNDLQNKFMVSEAETVAADQALEEAYDISKAKSPFARLKSFAQNIEAVQDDPFLSDIATPQKTQMDLNLNMFSPMQTDFMKMTDTDIINRRRQLANMGVQDLPSSRQLMADRDKEIADMKAKSLLDFGREQAFGTQGTFFGQPLAGGGIAKLAGDRSGPPPERGPNSQGLPGLLKRVRNL